MKLRIMQQGGGLIYTPFIPGAQGATTTTSSSNTSDSESKIDALDKELIALMKGQDLLPSDIDRITKSLITFQKRASQYAAVGDYSSVMPGVYQIQAEVLKAQTAKKQSDIVTQRMAKENAGSEVALDTYGRMYVQDKDGNVTKVTTSEFDEEKYRPISNSELLYYRQVSAADNGQIFNDLGNMVGMETVQKEMSDIIDNFGSIKGDRFETAKMRNIAEDIAKGDSIFKITEKYSKADLTDFSGLLLSQLSRDAQYRIKANAKLLGVTDKDYVRTIIDSRTDREQSTSYEASMTKVATGDSGSGSGSGSEKTVKDTYAERLVSGDGISPPDWINIMIAGSGVSLWAYTQGAGYILKDKNKMPTASLHSVLTQADAIGAIVNSKSVTFGDSLIDPRDFKNLMIDNDVEMQRVWLPVKKTADGRITPDFDAQKKLEQVQNYIEKNQGNVADAWIEEWLRNNLPEAVWDKEHGIVKFQQTDMLPFLVMHGVAGSNRVEFNKDSQYLYHDDRHDGHRWQEEYDRIVTEVTNTDKTGKRSAKGASRGKFYEGNVYLPILSPTIGSMVFNDQYFPQDVYTSITQKAANSETKRKIKTNF